MKYEAPQDASTWIQFDETWRAKVFAPNSILQLDQAGTEGAHITAQIFSSPRINVFASSSGHQNQPSGSRAKPVQPRGQDFCQNWSNGYDCPRPNCNRKHIGEKGSGQAPPRQLPPRQAPVAAAANAAAIQAAALPPKPNPIVNLRLNGPNAAR